MDQEVERYRKPTRILHWVIAVAFTVLFLTGLVLFVPALSFLAQGSWTRLVHRVAAIIFILAPAIYIPLNGKSSLEGIKEAFTWGRSDTGWLKAAPRYYFLSDEKAMPPQPHMNTGQKLWWLMVLIFGFIFVASGLVMLLFKTAPAQILQWMLLLHDIAFIATGLMFFVHVYLSVFHPLMGPRATGAWSSMARGKVSVEYAKSHHGKWYEELTRTGQIAIDPGNISNAGIMGSERQGSQTSDHQ